MTRRMTRSPRMTKNPGSKIQRILHLCDELFNIEMLIADSGFAICGKALNDHQIFTRQVGSIEAAIH